MIAFPVSLQVFVSLEPIDFRKGLHGLLALIESAFQPSVQGRNLFLFRDRTGRKIKAIYWDNNGFVLLYKVLSAGKFQFPALKNGSMQLDRLQLECLLSGMNFMRQTPFKDNEYTAFH